MCEINKISAIIGAANVALIAAPVLFVAAVINRTPSWGVSINAVLMGVAAILIGGALVGMSIAIALVSSCTAGRCSGSASTIRLLLSGLFTGLTVLLAGVILRILPNSTPWLGLARTVALVVGAAICIPTLLGIARSLRALATCLTGTIGVAAFIGMLTSVIAMASCFLIFVGLIPPG
jgi:hypothetical protein